MKHVMTAALIAAAMLTAPLGHADPDPHKPDPGKHFCPGGGTVDQMSPLEPSCDGVPYDDGAYWQLPGGAGTGMVIGGPPKIPGGGGGFTHWTTTREAVPGAPRFIARQYAPSS